MGVMKHVKVISRRLDYRNDWIQIYKSKVRLHDGKIVYWYTPKLEDSIIVIPIHENYVYLTKEWRIAWNKHLVTAPAGDIGRNTTEKQRVAQVRNELRQEIGFDAKTIRKLGKIFLSARTNQTCHVYLATGLFRNELARDEGEYIEIVKMPFKEAFHMFLSGELPTTSYCIVAFALAREMGSIGSISKETPC